MFWQERNVARDWRDDRIEQLEAQVREQQEVIRAQQSVIEELRTVVEAQRKTIAALEQRVASLEAQLAQFSGNSSKPPSSDPPGAPPPAQPKRTGRQRGGQPGHKKHERTLFPPEQVTRTHVLKPAACRQCGGKLTGDDPEPYRHQVVDIPKAPAQVDEYQLHALCCETCRVSTRATLPPGVPTGSFGPRLQAVVSVCSGAYRMGKRAIEEVVEDFWGIPISLGSIANLEQATSEAIAEPVQELAQALPKQPIVHMDETGWFERSKRAWLWVAAATQIAVFAIRFSRGAQVAKEMLGNAFAGILVTDRWHAYTWVDVSRRQLCWAHLLRQFRGFQDHGTEGQAIGRALELLTATMFHVWHRVRDGTMSRAEFQELIVPLRQHVVARLQEGACCATRAVAGRCGEILQLEPALWTFVHVDGVEPTNNFAESRVRHGVMWRKTSFGTDSPNGSRFVERILTVVSTLRLQRRNVLDYVTDACQCALRGQPAPSLLPS